MTEQKIFIAGKLTKVLLTKLSIDEIEYDSSNPRIGLQADMSESMDQEEIAFYLERKNVVAFGKLKTSIRENKGAVNPIWVMKTDRGYKILEGNTRLLIYRQLRDSEKEGNKHYINIQAYVIKGDVDENKADFIRLTAHLRGETQWDAYEKSRYLFILSEKGYSATRLEKLTKLRKGEIENSIEAFRIMSEQFLPKYGKNHSDVFKFSYFMEYAKDKKLHAVMDQSKFKDRNFCSWVGTGKIKRARDVRDLRKILSDQRTKSLFVKKGYAAAMDELAVIAPSEVKGIYYDVEQLIDDLGTKIHPEEILEMKTDKGDKKKQLLLQLQAKLENVLELIN